MMIICSQKPNCPSQRYPRHRPDHFLTPFSRAGSRMSGIEIHANVAYNLIQGSYIKQIQLLFPQVVGLLMAFLCGLLFCKFTPACDGAFFAMIIGASLSVFRRLHQHRNQQFS